VSTMGQGLSVRDARKVTGQAKYLGETEKNHAHVEDSETQGCNEISV
jgi:hypothetical protein